MSYTRLTFNDADITFFDQDSYSRLVYDNADITFFLPPTLEFEGIIAHFNQSVQVTSNEIIINVNQHVGIFASGNIVFFNQNVQLLEKFSGIIADFNQNLINSEDAQVIIPINNKVGKEDPNRFLRVGYEMEFIIGNEIIPQERLHGNFVYQKTTGQSTSVIFTILNKKGVQDPESYMGKSVVIRATTHEGTYTLFSGFIDAPSIDLIEEKTTFSCTDRRNARIKNLSFGSATFNGVSNVGRYSTALFGTPKDKLDELEKRLQTVPYDFDFDNHGNPQLTPWLPKSTPDFTLTGTPGAYNNNKVYYDQPQVIFSNPAARLNTVKLKVSHSYARLHQQIVNVSWTGYSNATLCSWWTDFGRGSFPQKATIESAARSGNWVVTRGIQFVELWPAQGFQCAGGSIIWQPNKLTTWTKPRVRFSGYLRDGEGRLIRDDNNNPVRNEEEVKDVHGNVIMDVYRTEIENTAIFLCRGAQWKAARKFSQNVTDEIEISMTVPSNLNKFGEILSEENYNVVSEYNTDQWDLNKTTIILTDNNAYIDKKTNIVEYDNALRTSLAKAKTTLLQAHRDVRVIFNRSLWPQIDVIHTVELNVDPVKCRGRVGSITHNVNFNTGKAVTSVELYLSRSSGSNSDSELSITPFVVDNPSYIGLETKTIRLGTHLGIDPEDPDAPANADTWNGYIGNKTVDGTAQAAGYRTNISERFIVDYPELPANLTDNRILKGFNEYSVDIPNDYLVIESNRYSDE